MRIGHRNPAVQAEPDATGNVRHVGVNSMPSFALYTLLILLVLAVFWGVLDAPFWLSLLLSCLLVDLAFRFGEGWSSRRTTRDVD